MLSPNVFFTLSSLDLRRLLNLKLIRNEKGKIQTTTRLEFISLKMKLRILRVGINHHFISLQKTNIQFLTGPWWSSSLERQSRYAQVWGFESGRFHFYFQDYKICELISSQNNKDRNFKSGCLGQERFYTERIITNLDFWWGPRQRTEIVILCSESFVSSLSKHWKQYCPPFEGQTCPEDRWNFQPIKVAFRKEEKGWRLIQNHCKTNIYSVWNDIIEWIR